ncbi:MAG: hypothetical protein LBI06_05855 [Treponema sp.]|jgi:hypothetical protein|nr:hypothetical protein [Treponema sp.]
MLIDIEGEVNKHRTCRDRNQLEIHIQDYKALARKHAMNFALAGQYNTVAFKLQEICDKLPATHLKHIDHSHAVPVKTAKISDQEKDRISAAWKQKTSHH